MPTTEGGLDFKNNLTQVIDGYPGHEHSFPIFPLYKDVIDMVAFSRTVYTPTLFGSLWRSMDGELLLRDRKPS